MQHRLNTRSKNNNPIAKMTIKIIVVFSLLAVIFYFVEKIQLPSPQKEIEKDVTDKIIRIK
tara:strand:- start:910 stop:1092 length:183 start_codon:yes stop_codon:yes gene_type:complete